MPTFYQAAAQEVFDQLKRPASGLKNEVVPALQKQYGTSVLPETKQKCQISDTAIYDCGKSWRHHRRNKNC